MKKLISLLLSAAAVQGLIVPAVSTAESDSELWDRFLRYDLCITNYSALTDEQKELCHFIFDTEQAACDNIICERARRTLAGDDVGERLTLDMLDGAYGVWDNYSQTKGYGWQFYTHCVPDIVYLMPDETSSLMPLEPYTKSVYWLDDAGSSYVIFNEKTSREDYRRYDVFNSDGTLIETIPAAMHEIPIKDYRAEISDYMEQYGIVEKNGGYYYIKPDGTAIFEWCIYSSADTSSAEVVTVPFTVEAEVNGCPVTAIEHGAFMNSGLTEIILPDTIEYIDREAFKNCKYLTDINFPNGLKYISNSAFFGCDSLTDIKLDCPELVIAAAAFYYMNGLKTAEINAKEIRYRAITLCANLESVVLGSSVETIGAEAFDSDISLTEINIPDSVKYIGQGALPEITSVTIPPSVSMIGVYPPKIGYMMRSGLDPVPPTHPLTDEPECVFDSNCVIRGYEGTEAERYAEEWGLEFIPLSYKKGDANCDESVDIADAVKVLQYIANPEKYPMTAHGLFNADVDGEAGITGADAIAIQSIDAGVWES